MKQHQTPPEIPVGPADVKHPRRALSRLALSAAAQETSESAASAVPTTSDAYGSAYDYVQHAASIASSAREVLNRAVVHAREIGGSWEDIGEALGITADEAEQSYTEVVERWEHALDEPWETSGTFLSSTLPSGVSDPDFTIGYLDRWCLTHMPADHASRGLARGDGTEDRMVSANLPAHTALTESNSVWRTGTHLTKRRVFSGPEWEAYQARKADVQARVRSGEVSRGA